jgi:hypothetical protein
MYVCMYTKVKCATDITLRRIVRLKSYQVQYKKGANLKQIIKFLGF